MILKIKSFCRYFFHEAPLRRAWNENIYCIYSPMWDCTCDLATTKGAQRTYRTWQLNFLVNFFTKGQRKKLHALFVLIEHPGKHVFGWRPLRHASSQQHCQRCLKFNVPVHSRRLKSWALSLAHQLVASYVLPTKIIVTTDVFFSQ